jgi:flavodoxin I
VNARHPLDARSVESTWYYADVGRKKRRLARNSFCENPSSRETSMKVTVVYGSSNGNTEQIAEMIASKIGGKSINVSSAKTNDFENCDLLILGAPTYEAGGLQQDWEERLDVLKEANLSGKKVALFGLGDQSSYPDSFVDAMGILYDAVTEKGATVIGETATGGYEFTNSLAVRDGKFVGLAVDEDGQPSETTQRIASWIAQLS